MKSVILLSIILVCAIGLTLSLTITADAGKIPSWIKNTALWWGQDQISDEDMLVVVSESIFYAVLGSQLHLKSMRLPQKLSQLLVLVK
jgi:hypothetical protein